MARGATRRPRAIRRSRSWLPAFECSTSSAAAANHRSRSSAWRHMPAPLIRRSARRCLEAVTADAPVAGKGMSTGPKTSVGTIRPPSGSTRPSPIEIVTVTAEASIEQHKSPPIDVTHQQDQGSHSWPQLRQCRVSYRPDCSRLPTSIICRSRMMLRARLGTLRAATLGRHQPAGACMNSTRRDEYAGPIMTPLPGRGTIS